MQSEGMVQGQVNTAAHATAARENLYWEDSSTALPGWGGRTVSFSRKELKVVQFRILPRVARLFAGAMALTRIRVAP